MALARWKDLCIDANDPVLVGEFWAGVLGLDGEIDDVGEMVLRGERPEQTIWINRVPEPKTVKHRLHLDIEVTSLDPLIERGATVLRPAGEEDHWTVMVDPEGGEFCAFVRAEIPTDAPARLYELELDCASPAESQALARWWADVLGATVHDDGRDFWWMEDVPGLPCDTWDFCPVPEPKTVKNRLHWDIVCDDRDALVERGATVLSPSDDEIRCTLMADPAGNEFCVFGSS